MNSYETEADWTDMDVEGFNFRRLDNSMKTEAFFINSKSEIESRLEII